MADIKKNGDANSRYKKKNYAQLLVRVSKVYDQDVLQKRESVDNKRQYILNLIRKDIESSGK